MVGEGGGELHWGLVGGRVKGIFQIFSKGNNSVF